MGCGLLPSRLLTRSINMLKTLVPVILFDNTYYGICIFVCIPILFNNECVNCIPEINVNTNVLLPFGVCTGVFLRIGIVIGHVVVINIVSH